jgi:hypothetical protein
MELLSSHRNPLGIEYRLPTVGFRCVLDTEKAALPNRAGGN